MKEVDISRRQVLRGASVAGTLGVASGAGAHALLADDEPIDGTTVTAGTLELRTAIEDLRDGDPCLWDPTLATETSSSEVTLDSPAGVVGIALTVCDTPGTVSLDLSAKEGHDLRITIVEGECDGRDVAEGPLSAVVEMLDGTVPLGSGCSYLGTPADPSIPSPGRPRAIASASTAVTTEAT